VPVIRLPYNWRVNSNILSELRDQRLSSAAQSVCGRLFREEATERRDRLGTVAETSAVDRSTERVDVRRGRGVERRRPTSVVNSRQTTSASRFDGVVGGRRRTFDPPMNDVDAEHVKSNFRVVAATTLLKYSAARLYLRMRMCVCVNGVSQETCELISASCYAIVGRAVFKGAFTGSNPRNSGGFTENDPQYTEGRAQGR